MNVLLSLLATILAVVHAQPDPEFRGVWIATVYNIDWPASSSSSPADQQADLINQLNAIQDLNLNAVIFQIRPMGDTFYESSLEPWSEFLTGTQGTAPSPLWDPLEFILTEAHARDLEVHAWFNPYRANVRGNTAGLAPNHMCFTYSEYCYAYGSNMWMDPGAADVQDYTVSVFMDVLNRYDVDGLHVDDYFYPYPVSGVDFPDSATYNEYLAQGGTLDLADWRRDNVNRLMERIYNSIKAAKPEVKFSISPFGIYRPCHPEGMPCSIAGLDQYNALYADPKLWLQQGWCDLMIPQLYWEIDPPAQSFRTLLDWWTDPSVNTANRQIYSGMAAYKVPDNGWPTNEIVRQVELSREFADRLSLGTVAFSWSQLRDNVQGLADDLKAQVYQEPADRP